MAVDIINADCDLTGYQLVIAPMLYMVRDGFADRARAYVEAGGNFVTTYWSGLSMKLIYVTGRFSARCVT